MSEALSQEVLQSSSKTPVTVFASQIPAASHVRRSEAEALMNRTELDGKGNKLKGRLKKATGDLTGNERLHDEGVVDEATGRIEETVGRARRKVGEAVEDIGKGIKR
jgi:uncharacterized protein YjbJ (UPF0337 family)